MWISHVTKGMVRPMTNRICSLVRLGPGKGTQGERLAKPMRAASPLTGGRCCGAEVQGPQHACQEARR